MFFVLILISPLFIRPPVLNSFVSYLYPEVELFSVELFSVELFSVELFSVELFSLGLFLLFFRSIFAYFQLVFRNLSIRNKGGLEYGKEKLFFYSCQSTPQQ